MEKNLKIKVIFITVLLISALTLLFFYLKVKGKEEVKTDNI